MKTKRPLIVISTVFVFLLACQTLAKPFAIQNNAPTQTQETVSRPTTEEITDEKGVNMRLVPEGEFLMGSDNGKSNESPIHTVYLDSYYIDKFEVTNALYRICVDANKCSWPSDLSSETHNNYYGNPEFDNFPIIYVDWNMAKVYCQWRGAQLPTEAQWEKAARGTDGRTYPWGEGIDHTLANYDASKGDTTAVGSYGSDVSPYGVYDMTGNVVEWVSDWYSESYYRNSPSSNPLGLNNGDYRVIRGGSWQYDADNSRITIRHKDLQLMTFSHIGVTYSDLGFRCALAVTISNPTVELTPTDAEQNSSLVSESVSEKDGMVEILVPAGEFVMGMNADDALVECQYFRNDCQRSWFEIEEPPHSVTLDAFRIDKTEVTNEMYSLCVEAGTCKEPTNASSYFNNYGNDQFNNYPVIFVDWNMAKTYCEWAERSLPTESQWEKAARGMDGRIYPWGNDAPNSNLSNNESQSTTGVGKHPDGISFYGAYDMAGNVWEWVNDWYSETYYQISPSSNPLGPDTGEYRVLRGGSWTNNNIMVRSTGRWGLTPNGSDFNIGFRCADTP